MFRTILTLLVVLPFCACRSTSHPPPGLSRCIWVDRWDWRTAADIERVLDDCKNTGFSTVMFQVRGNGTVAWPSQHEVWLEQFGFKDPGFDPLRVAVNGAHARGLQLHAWLNLMPGWSGDKAPSDTRQLWRARRDWFLMDRDGRFQIQKAGKYLTLNPCLPEVRDYLIGLCREVATNYPVDGIHLDYVRFPDAQGDNLDELGLDPLTLTVFSTSTGRTSKEVAAARQWQVDCVTATVRGIRDALARVPGQRVLTAAVIADRARALRDLRQDWGRWCEQGLVAAVVPMNYTADDSLFSARVADAVTASRGRVVMGVGSYQHRSPEQTTAQMDAALRAGAGGVAVFNYRTLFGKPEKDSKLDQAALRRRLQEWLRLPRT